MKRRGAKRQTILTAGCLVLLAALTACAGPADARSDGADGSITTTPTPTEAEALAIDCLTEPSVWVGSGATPAPGAHPTPRPLPDGFVAVAALRCSIPGVDGRTGDERAVVTRYEGDLGPLLAALALPDDAVGGACTLELELVPALWLEGDGGELLPVHWPRDACDKTKPDARTALDALTPVETTDVEIDFD